MSLDVIIPWLAWWVDSSVFSFESSKSSIEEIVNHIIGKYFFHQWDDKNLP